MEGRRDLRLAQVAAVSDAGVSQPRWGNAAAIRDKKGAEAGRLALCGMSLVARHGQAGQ